jgi:hypothetical protein
MLSAVSQNSTGMQRVYLSWLILDGIISVGGTNSQWQRGQNDQQADGHNALQIVVEEMTKQDLKIAVFEASHASYNAQPGGDSFGCSAHF